MEIVWGALLLVLTAWTYTAVGAIFFEHPGATNARASAVVGWMGIVACAALGLVPRGGMAPGMAAVVIVGLLGYAMLLYLDVPDDPRPRLLRDRRRQTSR